MPQKNGKPRVHLVREEPDQPILIKCRPRHLHTKTSPIQGITTYRATNGATYYCTQDQDQVTCDMCRLFGGLDLLRE